MATARIIVNETKAPLRFFIGPNNLKVLKDRNPQNAWVSEPISNLISQEHFKTNTGNGWSFRTAWAEQPNFRAIWEDCKTVRVQESALNGGIGCWKYGFGDVGQVEARGRPVIPDDEEIDEDEDDDGIEGEEIDGNFDGDEGDFDEGDSDDCSDDDDDKK